MRITPEILRKIARDTVAQRTRTNRDLLVVYLIGSLLREDPLIGGATDIDLVFIHNGEVEHKREIIRLTEDVHLDIAHHSRYLYHQTRELRLNPWMGPNIYHCKILHDPQHFMDFTQASVSGQFHQPDNIIARSRILSEGSRQTWLAYQLETPQAGPDEISAYLKAVGDAANAVASLSGPPLVERRMLLEFPERAARAGHPGMDKGLLGLLGAPRIGKEQIQSWIPAWRAAIEAVPPDLAPDRLHPHRVPYYQKALEAMIAGAEPGISLWPLLQTWTAGVCLLPEGSPHLEKWEQATQQLGLVGEGFQERLSALDSFLDTVDETLEEWGRSHGVIN